MATKKKYTNNVDSGVRHHYDVYEVNGEQAFHIAPFTQEMDALRCAEAYAALEVLDEGVEQTSRYVVRARPTVAHAIYKTDAKTVGRTYKNINEARARMIKLFEGSNDFWAEPGVGETKDAEPEITPKPKKRSILKKKTKA